MKPGSGWREPYLRYKAYSLNMARQYKERKDIKAYIELLLSLATVSIFAIFALRPTLITIAGLIKDIEKKNETIEIMDKKIEELRLADENYNARLSQIRLLETAIPSDASPEMVLRQIEGLISQNPSNVRLLSIGNAYLVGQGISSVRQPENLTPLPENTPSLVFTVSVSGEYASLASFLQDLTTLRRPIRIDSINFAIQKDKEVEELVLNIESRTPYFGNISKQDKTP